MRKKTLNKTIRRSITGSLGRFISIFSLMLLGVFAFVGLKVSGPNMRATAEHFYKQHQLADLTVTSTLGLDASDQALIRQATGLKNIEFGSFSDVLIKGSTQSLRLFSQPEKLSTYALMSGKMPQADNEIALDYLYEKDYKLGDNLQFTAGKESDLLKNHRFKIVGFVKSSEYVDKNNFGPTTIGTGKLSGYALVPKTAFKSDLYTIARLSYRNLQEESMYDQTYDTKLEKHQKALENLLKDQPAKRLADLKSAPQAQLNQAQAQLNAQKIQLASQQEQLKAQKAALAERLPIAPQVQAQLEVQEAQLTQAQAKMESAQAELKTNAAQLAALTAPIYTVNNRKEGNPGYQSFMDDSTRIDRLSNIFPVVLFAIALLVTLTTMTRFVEEERSNLGLLKALGYTNQAIRKKFLVYGLVSSGSGALVGVILGHTLLPIAVFNAYTASSTFSQLRLTFSLFWTIVAFAIALSCSLLPAYWVVRSELKEVPAGLFLAKVPKAGSRILLERLPFIWNRLGFTYKVTARNLFRYKKRMLMTIFGVAGCTALLVMGFGIRDSISGLSSRQFGSILHYDLLVLEKEQSTAKQKEALIKKLDSTEFTGHLPIVFESLSHKNDGEKQQISLIVPQDSADLSKFVSLQNRQSGKKLLLKDSGVVITEKLATLMNLKVGDQAEFLDSENKKHQLQIAGVTEMYMGHYIFMTKSAYAQAFDEQFTPNAQLAQLKNPTSGHLRQVSTDLMSLPVVKGISQNSDLKTTINSFMHGINSVMFVLISCAILLAIVVIYNLTNINVSERIRELSTIKVLGFYDREVTFYIYRETIFLSFIGIGSGFLLGAFFHHFIISQLAADQIMFAPGLLWSNLALSALITFATTASLAFVVHFKLKAIDMLGALKSID